MATKELKNQMDGFMKPATAEAAINHPDRVNRLIAARIVAKPKSIPSVKPNQCLR